MNFEQVQECLSNDGWPVEVLSESTMRSKFRGGSRVLPLFVHLDGAFVVLAVIPFAQVPEDEDRADKLFDRLLRLNREMNLAKLSIDEDGDVILSVEYPLEDLDPSEVRDALDVLSFYADKYSTEIRALTGDDGGQGPPTPGAPISPSK